MATRSEIEAAARRVLINVQPRPGQNVDDIHLCARIALEAATAKSEGYKVQHPNVKAPVFKSRRGRIRDLAKRFGGDWIELIRRPTGKVPDGDDKSL